MAQNAQIVRKYQRLTVGPTDAEARQIHARHDKRKIRNGLKICTCGKLKNRTRMKQNEKEGTILSLHFRIEKARARVRAKRKIVLFNLAVIMKAKIFYEMFFFVSSSLKAVHGNDLTVLGWSTFAFVSPTRAFAQ